MSKYLATMEKLLFNRKEALIELWEGQLCSATGWDEGKEKTAEGGRTKGTLWERDSLIITNIDVVCKHVQSEKSDQTPTISFLCKIWIPLS